MTQPSLAAGGGREVAETLRRGVLGLTALGILGTTIELVFLRHWSSGLQLVVWPALIGLTIAAWTVVRRPTPTGLRRARALSGAVLVVAVLGVSVHIWANLEAAPLDRRYESTWATLPAAEQWFLAITGGVGPAPTLAPGVLVEIALGVLLATVGHPGARSDRRST